MQAIRVLGDELHHSVPLWNHQRHPAIGVPRARPVWIFGALVIAGLNAQPFSAGRHLDPSATLLQLLDTRLQRITLGT